MWLQHPSIHASRRGQPLHAEFGRGRAYSALKMAHELFSIWGPKIGWRSLRHPGYEVTAELDGIHICYRASTAAEVDRLFYRACRRVFLRRYFKWLKPPPERIGVQE
jgi:hypothetical protein